uniref:Retrovirus-related Pol polyprotein LINE-1 n=1 Tax=Cajanus cajan TaxID=3821 RepID=A0A151S3Q3_CAJCA|nr:Retrovirus-related Pol polyprotein LINE-1 [Cajanus cajan]
MSLCCFIHSCEQELRKIYEINATLITLIPKVNNVVSLKQMRPISLYNVYYKVITKVLASRRRKVMEGLVSPNQCSFVPHRQTTDNIIITQEVIHSMKNRSRKKGWMAIKIDLEKAYDRLKWKFIKDTLEDIGLPQQFVEMVWACISTPSMSMLWNGEKLEDFTPSKGIRQGDPLSPYLFVLCMERVFHLIEIAVIHKLWKPIKLSKGGPPLSCLAFADDLILFSEASMDQVEIIQQCLDIFCGSLGQKVSLEKTRIFFSKNVGWAVKNEISNAFGFQRTDNLGKYLGVSIHHDRVNRRLLRSVKDKVNQRLNSWKTRNLSVTGRLTLTKSVLAAIPSYTMQTVFFPDSFVMKLTGLRKVHVKAWQKIYKPKDERGLGMREMRLVNKCFMMKNCWTICSQPSKLWVQVLRDKYKCGNASVPNIEKKSRASNAWKGICDARSSVQPFIAWNVGDGTQVQFWKDRWLPSRTCLLEVALEPVLEHERGKFVSEYITEEGLWNLNNIRFLLPMSAWFEVIGSAPPSIEVDPNVMVWGGSPTGAFSIKSAYNTI